MGTFLVSWLLCLSYLSWTPSVQASPVSSCGLSCQQAQVRALVDLYAATGGSEWFNSEGWSSLVPTTSLSDVCALLTSNGQGWCCYSSQTMCSGADGIGMLTLPRNNLRGTLPSSFFTALGPTLMSVVLLGARHIFDCLLPSWCVCWKLLAYAVTLAGSQPSCVI